MFGYGRNLPPKPHLALPLVAIPITTNRVRSTSVPVMAGALIITPASSDPVRSSGSFAQMYFTNPGGTFSPVRWQFNDLADGTSYVFEINPNADGSPQRRRNLTAVPTTAADGAPVVFEGTTGPPTGQFSGVLHSQAQYDAFVTWFKKRTIVQISDDLGRWQRVYITSFKPTAAFSYRHPNRAKYTVTYIVVDPGNA
jgi:hypothetical protein